MAKKTAKKEEAVVINKKSLVAAAKDINKADICDPAIDEKGSEAELKKALLAANEIIEEEDDLKKSTFALLAALAEEDPEEEEDETEEDDENEEEDDADGDADSDEEEVETEEEEDLNALTVKELQKRCKAAGLKFKDKKTTKKQLIAMLKADAEEEADEPEPEEAPASKPEKKKQAAGGKKKGGKDSGPGVIASILEFITKSGKKGITKEEIGEKLTARFPERESVAMMKTINAQIGGKKSPTRMEREKAVEFAIKNDKYGIK